MTEELIVSWSLLLVYLIDFAKDKDFIQNETINLSDINRDLR